MYPIKEPTFLSPWRFYDELTMPLELRKAHHQNDMAVMQAYGFIKGSEAYKNEAACVAELMKFYQKKVEEIEKR